MGLAQPRNKQKLSRDPNNTAWTRSTTNYGHRIMSAHGWQPGMDLGAGCAQANANTNANPNPNPHTHATPSASLYLRLAVKDDKLGLGANRTGLGGANGGVLRAAGYATGLDGLQDLFGRLNGNEDAEVEKVRAAREELRMQELAERRWGKTGGGLRGFVSAGWLVGSVVQTTLGGEEKKEKDVGDLVDVVDEAVTVEVSAGPGSKKKRKRAEEAYPDHADAKADVTSPVAVAVSAGPESKKKRKRAEDADPAPAGADAENTTHPSKKRKGQKTKQPAPPGLVDTITTQPDALDGSKTKANKPKAKKSSDRTAKDKDKVRLKHQHKDTPMPTHTHKHKHKHRSLTDGPRRGRRRTRSSDERARQHRLPSSPSPSVERFPLPPGFTPPTGRLGLDALMLRELLMMMRT
ncbi:MAG: telomerase inhibitor [Phylliscum demangeonii]|nr:MAG: telomerase inhibitor [Phylliscum demangeonii]